MKKAVTRGKPRMGNLSQMRSGFEKRGREFMEANGIKFGYETTKVPYTIPATKRNYHPDFDIGGVHYEFKGRWVAADRAKMLLVTQQNPGIKLVIVFQRPQNTLSSSSKTTYAQWATKHGFEWIDFPEWQARLLALKKEGKL